MNEPTIGPRHMKDDQHGMWRHRHASQNLSGIEWYQTTCSESAYRRCPSAVGSVQALLYVLHTEA